jgi:hypothetical protein
MLLLLVCRCGLSPSSLVEMKRNTLAALADCMELEDLLVSIFMWCCLGIRMKEVTSLNNTRQPKTVPICVCCPYRHGYAPQHLASKFLALCFAMPLSCLCVAKYLDFLQHQKHRSYSAIA